MYTHTMALLQVFTACHTSNVRSIQVANRAGHGQQTGLASGLQIVSPKVYINRATSPKFQVRSTLAHCISGAAGPYPT